MLIDPTFDFRTDSNGKDPDSHSPTLRAYQRFLYSKPLPNGEVMELSEKLNWKDFWFSSDSILHGFIGWDSYKHITAKADQELIKQYEAADYYISGEIIFPCYSVAGTQTINQARGCNHRIRDRIDLTMECIRRFYLGEESPLFKCLSGYKPFFDLFVDFKGYTDFFFMQDLVTVDYSAIKFLTWFDDFNSTFPLPRTVEEYNEYMKRVIEFNEARSRRIVDWCKEQSDNTVSGTIFDEDHAQAITKPGAVVRHFKREVDGEGNNYLYRVIGKAQHTETDEEMMVYQALYGDKKLYVRPLKDYLEPVDRQKYPDIRQKYRFELYGKDPGEI